MESYIRVLVCQLSTKRASVEVIAASTLQLLKHAQAKLASSLNTALLTNTILSSNNSFAFTWDQPTIFFTRNQPKNFLYIHGMKKFFAQNQPTIFFTWNQPTIFYIHGINKFFCSELTNNF